MNTLITLHRSTPLADSPHVETRATLALLLTMSTASAVSAQALTQNQGPNLGTWAYGYIDLELAGEWRGRRWDLCVVGGGRLAPTGSLLLADRRAAVRPLNANAGLIGVGTAPGVYNFTSA